ncbi:MAG: nucleoside triphosphate pyrophosphatase [Thermosediminibacterales bacterium]|nr:nucleoside triphosphate pyrophosphatase [Thermosediminibacterales bacterium]
MNKKIVLASASPRRKELLEQMGLRFEVIPSSIEEKEFNYNMPPEMLACKLALLKSEQVAKQQKNSLVIGADTIVVQDKVFGKPENKKDAYWMLKSLTGKPHQVITGLAVIDSETGDKKVEYEKTVVYMRQISDEEIKAYINTGEPMDKAGAYGIQGLGGLFVEKIDGCFFNVVGLPVSKLYTILKNFGVKFFE